MNPWEEIKLDEYEKHMSLADVYQLQSLNKMMKEQFNQDKCKSIMILGIAGGNGLEHIRSEKVDIVYGVDINANYLKQCQIRYPELKNCLKVICADLTRDNLQLPQVDLLVADLLIEYIGYDCFKKVVKKTNAKIVSCIIQINVDDSFVSDSPYIHIFDKLEEIHYKMEENELKKIMNEIGYNQNKRIEQILPNGKKLVRIDFLR